MRSDPPAEAVAPAEEAVELYRQLADDNPAFQPNLAAALTNLGVGYGEVGRRAEAVAPAEEAVELYRQLAADNPAFQPNLAAALTNLGNRYGEVGRRAEAVALMQEALTDLRRLADTAPDIYMPELATSLTSLSM